MTSSGWEIKVIEGGILLMNNKTLKKNGDWVTSHTTQIPIKFEMCDRSWGCLPFPKERVNWRRLKKIFGFSTVPSRRAELKNHS